MNKIIEQIFKYKTPDAAKLLSYGFQFDGKKIFSGYHMNKKNWITVFK